MMSQFEIYPTTDKGKKFAAFACEVVEHIETYACKQYGDTQENDLISRMTPEKIQGKLEAYVARIGSNARGKAEAKRDCLKIAHYAQLLLDKYEQEEGGHD
jgi:ornithine cyclodeaminase/alanine dehydrogenase-like protein (mu-crystallin family)